jgi:hypothetical protein
VEGLGGWVLAVQPFEFQAFILEYEACSIAREQERRRTSVTGSDGNMVLGRCELRRNAKHLLVCRFMLLLTGTEGRLRWPVSECARRQE